MEIKTKFNVLDEVYFMHENKVHRAKIIALLIEVYKQSPSIIKTDITYKFGYVRKPEELVFKTKEELLKSL
jgi:hypothetical protein